MVRPREETNRTAQAVAAQINKTHGDGTVVLASVARIKPPRLSTGSLALDVTTGGGWPTNEWSEVCGLEGSGKTTLVLKSIAHAQDLDPKFSVAWIAAESYDAEYAGLLGVDNSRVFLVEENVMEIAYDAALRFAENRACDMIVIDSLPALVPADENEKSMEEYSPGRAAFRTNQFMRKCTKATKRSLVEEDRPLVGIIINQWRNKIGVMYGDPRTTPGGLGKNFWMHMRVEVKREEWITDPETKRKVGQSIKVNTFKMKGARPGEPAVVDFYFADCGEIRAGTYDVVQETLNLALLHEVVRRRGNAYVYEDLRYVGKAEFFRALREDKQLYARVRKEVLDAARGALPEPDPEPSAARSRIRRTR